MATTTDDAQGALNAFVTTQLIDNGMETLARKINHLYQKIQTAEQQQEPPLSTKTKMKYAKKLQHLLMAACHVVQHQRNELDQCIDAVEYEFKHRGDDNPSKKDKKTSHYEVPGDWIYTPEHADIVRQCHDENVAIGCHVAARVTRSHELWILARVIAYEAANNTYSVEDVDTGDEDNNEAARTHHFVPRYHIMQLPGEFLPPNAWIQYGMNQRVLAMYPNTTSFYRAQVRVPNPKGAPYVIVQFDDDGEEIGGAPFIKVPVRFVAPVPVENAQTKR